VPEIIDPVFAKTSQNARFLLSEYERFGLVFTKTRVYKFGHWTEMTDAGMPMPVSLILMPGYASCLLIDLLIL
jgi:hypothetical protein